MKKQIMFVICFIFLIGMVSAIDVNKVGDWWGTVTINGNNDSDGAVVKAYMNNSLVESATVGQYTSGYYLMHIEGNGGDNIIFKVNGKEATTEIWSNGDHELNLEISINDYDDDDSSSNNNNGGSSSGGGGGGNSGGSSTTTLTSSSGNSNIGNVINLSSDEDKSDSDETDSTEKSTPLTGSVISNFASSPAGITTIICMITILVGGISIMYMRKSKLEKKIENSETTKEKV